MTARALRRRAPLLLAALAGLLAAHAGSAPVPERGVAPAFAVRTAAGEPLALAELLERGPVVLDFWATWCKPCLASLPELEALHRRHGPRGLTVVGISVDGPRNFARVRPFANRLGLTFPIVLDADGRLQQLYQVRAVPTTLVIAPDGRIVRVRQGWVPGDLAAVAAAVDTLVGAETAR